MIVPPDITVLLIFIACLLTVAYFLDKKLRRWKTTTKPTRFYHPPKVTFHRALREDEKE